MIVYDIYKTIQSASNFQKKGTTELSQMNYLFNLAQLNLLKELIEYTKINKLYVRGGNSSATSKTGGGVDFFDDELERFIVNKDLKTGQNNLSNSEITLDDNFLQLVNDSFYVKDGSKEYIAERLNYTTLNKPKDRRYLQYRLNANKITLLNTDFQRAVTAKDILYYENKEVFLSLDNKGAINKSGSTDFTFSPLMKDYIIDYILFYIGLRDNRQEIISVVNAKEVIGQGKLNNRFGKLD